MSVALLPDALWDLVEPLLPIPPRRPKGGRPRVSDRACLTGIVFVLRSGVPWRMLPLEFGCGSGMTCWRRLRDWQQAGGADIHEAFLSLGCVMICWHILRKTWVTSKFSCGSRFPGNGFGALDRTLAITIRVVAARECEK